MKKQLLSIIGLLAFVFYSHAQTPVAAYHFHNGNYYDLAGSNLHLNALGDVSASMDADGNDNSAATINGGYLDAGDQEELEFTGGAITISAWVRLNNPISDWTALVNKWEGGVGGYYLGVNPDNGRIRFNAFIDNVEDNAPAPVNEWVHIAASYDGTTINLYRNGNIVGTKTALGAIQPNATPFRIGRQSDIASSLFFGNIDEVLLFGEALEQQSIIDIYTNGLPVFANDIAVVTVDNESFTLAPNDVNVIGKAINVGTENITSFDMTWSDGANNFNEQVTGIDLAPYEEYDFSLANLLSLQAGENKDILVSADQPNGQADDNLANNDASGNIWGVYLIADKRVFVEEGTGTWCQWCPRGAVGLEYMFTNYPDDFIGIAFHSGDTMQIPGYQTGFASFPSGRLDRKLSVDPSAGELELALTNKQGQLVKASIGQEVGYSPTTREIFVTVFTEMAIPLEGDHRFNLYIVEDHVTGDTPGFAQANAYANNANGPMGGYENLPNPVPADQMVYDHVARAVLGDFDGVPNSLPDVLELGETYSYNFSYTLPDEYDENEIHIVATLHDVAGNDVLNAVSTHLSDADVILDSDHEVFVDNLVKVFPNPADNFTNIKIDLEENSNVELNVINAIGQSVALRDYGVLNGEMILPFNTANLSDGMYYLFLKIDEQLTVEKLVVERN